MEKFTFTRQADGSLHATDQTKASVALAFRQNPGTLSREADLVNKAKDLAFSTGKSYEEASTHLMSRDPWLALAVAVIGDDRADKALGIEIVEGARA
jgi:hypothetical protein